MDLFLNSCFLVLLTTQSILGSSHIYTDIHTFYTFQHFFIWGQFKIDMQNFSRMSVHYVWIVKN